MENLRLEGVSMWLWLGGGETDPGNVTLKEAVKDMLIAKNRMASDAVEEDLQHTSPPSDQVRIFFGFALVGYKLRPLRRTLRRTCLMA